MRSCPGSLGPLGWASCPGEPQTCLGMCPGACPCLPRPLEAVCAEGRAGPRSGEAAEGPGSARLCRAGRLRVDLLSPLMGCTRWPGHVCAAGRLQDDLLSPLTGCTLARMHVCGWVACVRGFRAPLRASSVMSGPRVQGANLELPLSIKAAPPMTHSQMRPACPLSRGPEFSGAWPGSTSGPRSSQVGCRAPPLPKGRGGFVQPRSWPPCPKDVPAGGTRPAEIPQH